MCLSQRLKTLRKEYEITQRDICSKLSISTATLSQYENGLRQPSYDILKKIADFYNVSIDYLLGRTDIKKVNNWCNMNFANRLKLLRKEKGLNQTELAKEFNITSRTISQYEKGIRTPDLIQLDRLANFFNVSTDYLLGRTNMKIYSENIILTYTDDITHQLSEDDKKLLDEFIDFLITRSK